MVIRIGDEQPATRFVGEDLARKGQRRRSNPIPLERRGNRVAIDLPLFVEDLNHGPDRLVERVALAFARRRRDDVALRIDEHLRGPRPRAICLPDREIRVVDHRMIDVVANENPADVVGLAFVRELRRVHADDDELVAVFLFEPAQIRQDVHAVDAPVRPEIKQDDLAAKVLQRERTGHVEPLDAAREVGRPNARVASSERHHRRECRSAARAATPTSANRNQRSKLTPAARRIAMSAPLVGVRSSVRPAPV